MIKDSLKLVALFGFLILIAWLGSVSLATTATMLAGMALGGAVVFVGVRRGVLSAKEEK